MTSAEDLVPKFRKQSGWLCVVTERWKLTYFVWEQWNVLRKSQAVRLCLLKTISDFTHNAPLPCFPHSTPHLDDSTGTTESVRGTEGKSTKTQTDLREVTHCSIKPALRYLLMEFPFVCSETKTHSHHCLYNTRPHITSLMSTGPGVLNVPCYILMDQTHVVALFLLSMK